MIAGRVLAPIAHITGVAREIQARELSRRIELDGPDDELKRLADTFDSMLARLDLAFASQRRFVADASHELRTPLAIIKANLDLALTDSQATDESRATAAAVIKRAIDRMARLTDDLLALARLDAPASGREPVPLGGAARGRTRGVRGGRSRTGGRASRRRSSPAGSSRATGTCSSGRSRTCSTTRSGSRRRDRACGSRTARSTAGPGSPSPTTAPGSPPADQEWIFDRFWRADDARSRPGGGSGLGLAIVRQIAEAHRGAVDVHSEPGAGATFVVWLPRTGDPGDAPGIDPTRLGLEAAAGQADVRVLGRAAVGLD